MSNFTQRSPDGRWPRFLTTFASIACVAVTLACRASPVPLPQIPPDLSSSATPGALAAPPARGNPSIKRVPLDAAPLAVYRSGDRNDWDVVVTPELAAAYAAYRSRDIDGVLAALGRYTGADADASARWVSGTLRFDAFLQLGRAADAEAAADELVAPERELLGHALLSRAMRGLARMELAAYHAALGDFEAVAAAIGSWSLPTSYSAVPTNLLAVRAFSEAQLRAYAGIASVHLVRRDFAAALRWAEAAEGLFNDLYYVLTHPRYGNNKIPEGVGEGRAYNLAVVGAARSVTRKDYAAGARELEEARRFFAAVNHGQGLAVVEAIRAMVAQQLGRLEEAEAIAREGERIAAAAGLGGMVWQLAAERGAALLALGRKVESEAAFRSAQNGIELASGVLSSESAKLRFGVGKEQVTRHLTRFALERGDIATLFRDMERARARAFIDMLGDQPVALGRHTGLVAAVRTLDRRMLRQRLLNGAPGGVRDGAARIEALSEERARRIAELRSVDPELADTLAVRATEMKDVQHRLGASEILVYSIPGEPDERIRLLLVARQSERVLEASLTDRELSRLLTEFGSSLRRLDVQRQRTLAAAIAAGLELREWPTPAAAYFVPSGALHFVPWGALDIDFPVAVLPTGGWLLRTPVATRRAGAAAIVGDPDYRGSFEQLPGARREAIEVGAIYQSEPLLGDAATEQALRARVDNGTDVLHLATHGFFNAVKPLASFLVLSGGEQARALTASRLFEAPLPAKLVVLSACETGLGKAVAGDDFLGLPRSFYIGGTLAVLSSLWPVEDAGTRAFMKAFHERARGGDYGSAWLAARDLLRAQGFSPFVYGAFVLGGALKG